MKTIKIESKIIGYKRPVFIVAEAGVNHNGSLKTALNLVEEAKKAGADAVKFQSFRADDLATPKAAMACCQKKNLGKNEPQVKLLKKLELKASDFVKIKNHCNRQGIIFLSTPHTEKAFEFLAPLVPAFKVGSGDLTNLPFLEKIAKKKKPIILSTGMATLKEVKEAIECIKRTGNKKLIVLHCTTNYPCPGNEVNLRAMQTMMEKLGVLVGYSDHTLGFQTSIMATALSACVIEKHFTLSKSQPGPDHKASLEPSEFKELVERIRKAEVILGSAEKKPTKSEALMQKTIRKCLVALRDIKRGAQFTKENLGIKRPGTGLSPKLYFWVLGKKAKTNIKKNTLLQKKHY